MAQYEMPEAAESPSDTAGRKMSVADLTKWKALIKVAEAYQKKKGNFPSAAGVTEGRWDVNIKALDGDFNSRMELGEEAVDVNITHATVQTLLSPLWTTLPYITVTATQAKYQDEDEEADNILRARLTEYEINYWFKRLKINHVNKKCVLDNAACNVGYAYLGYIASKNEIENDEGEATENEPQIELKAPYVKRICPKNILVPSGYYDIEEAPWIAICWPKPCCDVSDRYGVKDLKADLLYLSENDLPTDLTGEMAEYLKSDDAGYVMLWQVWDKRSAKLITLTMGQEDALEVTDWPVETDGFPISKQRFNWTPDQQFGMPLMSAWLAQQKELNAARTTTRSREARTKSGIFMLNAPEGLEDSYKKAGDGFVINLAADTDDIRKLIQVDPGLPPANSAYNYGAVSMQDLFTISGLGANQRSQGDPNSGSATESALIDKWAMIRQTDMGNTVRDFYVEIAKKLWMILKQFPNTKRDMLVMGPEGSLQRITYTLANLKGEFQFTMELASLYADDPGTRKQNAMALYNLMRQDPLIKGEKLATDVFEAFNKYDVESYMTTLMSPDEEFMKTLQGLPVQANELDDHAAHLKAHDSQMTQLEGSIHTSRAGSPEETKARLAMLGMMAHVNDHARIMAEMDSKKGAGKGKPIAENALRSQVNAPSAGETAAETAGNPMQGSASPSGIQAA